MDDLRNRLHAAANGSDFSGVVDIRRGDDQLLTLSTGHANRRTGTAIGPDTVFATASAAKGITALTIASLIDDGVTSFDATVESILGDRLPLVHAGTNLAQLLTHTSGIGDYLDEEEEVDIEDFRLPISVDALLCADDYLPLIDHLPPADDPGSQFKYNNAGFVVLALVIEALTESSYHEQVQQRVFGVAGMESSAFLRPDQLQANVALGYLANGETNRDCIPYAGIGDGGLYTTAGDLDRLWTALFAGEVVRPTTVERLTTELNQHDTDNTYGMGFWLQPNRSTVALEGMDAGVSMRTVHERQSGVTFTVISNTTHGAWPLVNIVDESIAAIAAQHPRVR